MNIIIEKSTKQALELQLLKNHLRIEHHHEDEYLASIIDMSTELLEKNINQSILKKKYQYTLSPHQSETKIEMPFDNICEIVSVQSDNKPIQYSATQNNHKTYLIINTTNHPIKIEYYAGIFEENQSIPPDLKYAIIQISKNIYDSCDENILGSQYIKNTINSYRKLSIN